mmetsp:Transcript_16880/g.47388  ORF Transcript_16880/g.47388 Transcript_16880/m.47388 type:complete len:353 (-) Transcript_16880:92-1150(-)|eukprot:CAMPEP_0119565320 /NCGR_PEP_ID=MMETSP1352-20130426/29610_1 /TAXON_ID=265584 /ORGANISM="Stauroneis constricta, Strain CCMP1120" /LENGTH=352 /DNA_ID=CAMNT_0007614201 /DNA_START=161 /DNA_END=1219 /DNA_ORIENTATION=+
MMMMNYASILVLLSSTLSSSVDAFIATTPNQQQQRHVETSLNAGPNGSAMMPLRRGSTCALLTPFTESGDIDLRNLEQLLQMHVDQGTDNLCVLGTTAEAATMSMEEREIVLKKVVEIAKGKIPIMVGTGTINPTSVKAMTQQAIDLGADANLLVSPYYVKPPQRALVKLFTQTADMGLPVVLYNVPGRTNVDISDETLALCAEHDKIVAVKDATGDLSRVQSLRARLSGTKNADLLLYSGDDASTLDFILKGGDGCISVTANLAPKTMSEMVHAALDGDEEKARALNEPLLSLHNDLFVESNPIPCKWAAMKLGLINSAYCRLPLDAMDASHEPTIMAALQTAGLAELVID